MNAPASLRPDRSLPLAILKQRFGDRFSDGQAVREQHGPHDDLDAQSTAGRRCLGDERGGGAGLGEGLRRAPHAHHPLRHRLVAGGPCQRAARRRLGQHQPHEPHPARLGRGPRLHGRARHDAKGPQRAPARHRPLLPRRSRCGREPGWHGRYARQRHQRGALRHDEGLDHRARRRAGERRDAAHGPAGPGRPRPATTSPGSSSDRRARSAS